MNDREQEIKIDLQSESYYRKLLESFGPGSDEIRQDNHFFDTADRALARSGWALRIRIEADKAIMTLKGKAAKSNLLHLTDRPEYSAVIPLSVAQKYITDGLEAAILPDKFTPVLSNIPLVSTMFRRLHFVNFRRRAIYKTSDICLELEIDRTIFADNSVDYELEIELAGEESYPAAIEAIAALLKERGIPLKFQPEGKLARAMGRSAKR